MPTRPLERLMFAQGGLCFFCRKPLPKNEASVEHLVASAKGGNNHDDNCVVCCKSMNALLGSMSLKEKIQVVLNQKGQFKCPNGSGKAGASASVPSPSKGHPPKPTLDNLGLVIADLRKKGSTRPRTVKTLRNTINALFQKKLTDREVTSLLERLQAGGMVQVADTKVSYALPQEDS
jgi:hypothetical protein